MHVTFRVQAFDWTAAAGPEGKQALREALARLQAERIPTVYGILRAAKFSERGDESVRRLVGIAVPGVRSVGGFPAILLRWKRSSRASTTPWMVIAWSHFARSAAGERDVDSSALAPSGGVRRAPQVRCDPQSRRRTSPLDLPQTARVGTLPSSRKFARDRVNGLLRLRVAGCFTGRMHGINLASMIRHERRRAALGVTETARRAGWSRSAQWRLETSARYFCDPTRGSCLGSLTDDAPELLRGERLHEEFRRRVKTQGSLPSEDALVLLFSLVASGQIKLRRIEGWRKIATVLSQHTAVAA